MSKLGNVLSKLVQVKHITDGVRGQSPQPPEAVGDFWKKITSLMLLNHISHFGRTRFLTFESQLKKIK